MMSCSSFVLRAQTLPPVAQALYDSAVAQDPNIVQYALNAGAQIRATPDDSSFYIQWFPVGFPPATTPVIVTLHGSDGYAFHEFFNWHQAAFQHGCGIIAIQWYRGPQSSPPYDYFDDSRLYEFIDTALTRINYPSGKAFYHGFSRASARSYGVIFNDSHGGQNYFCTALSNAGGVDSMYPLYDSIYDNFYGPNVFAGKHWALYCGANDNNPAMSGCPAMSYTQTWLISQGASVDVFFQDPIGDHDGFNDTTIYRDSILNYYLLCFYGLLTVDQLPNNAQPPNIYPNPTDGILHLPYYSSRSIIEIRDMTGRCVFLNSWNPEIDVSYLTSGIYVVSIIEGEEILSRVKFVKM